jgi:conjugative relaxase-like TrwC/TraI family protein
VISIKALSGNKAADYYLERDAGCEADYYLDPQEAAGRWVGGGARALGLVGALDEAGELAFRRLLAGADPTADEPLVKPVMRADPAGRLLGRPLVEALQQAAHERGLLDPTPLFGTERLADDYLRVASLVRRRPFKARLDPRVAIALADAAGLDPVSLYRDPTTGADRFTPALERAADMVDMRCSGYDVCFSAPKSVSTLFGLASPSIATTVRSSHDTAIQAALDYLERVASHGCRGHRGDGHRQTRIKTDGFVAAAFGHRTSRANDPQLHTHVVLANLVHGEDGKWTAVDSHILWRHAQTASYLYQATLRSELTERLGVGWTGVDKGIASIVGVPKDLADAFSTRSDEIENELAEVGRDDPAAAQRACLKTRPPKRHVGEQDLRSQWAAKAMSMGYDPAGLVESVVGRTQPPAVDADALARQLTASTGMTRTKTTVDMRDVIESVCEALPGGATVTLSRIDELSRHVTSGAGVLPLKTRGDDDARFTTAELVAVEQRALATAEQLRSCVTGQPGSLSLHQSLSEEQRRLVMELIGDSGLCVVVGPAGSGKTTALAAANRGWRAAGVPVYGAAVSAIAARGLQRMTQIPSSTLERLLQQLDEIDPRTRRPAGLQVGSVLVIDEASMVDTRTMGRLLEHSYRSQARLVLVGDTEQLPEIEAGGLFRAIADHPSTVRLSGNARQVSEWEAYALGDLREGRVGRALAAYSDAGRVHVFDTPVELREALVEAYLAAKDVTPDAAVVVLATSRREVRALNEALRLQLRERGALGDDGVIVQLGSGHREFASGDEVLITKNHYSQGVLNDTRGRVVSFDRADQSLLVRDVDGVEHRLDRRLLESGDVQHGYAMTVHKAQGLTLDVALVSGSSTLRKEAGYVAMSRGAVANHLFVTYDDLRSNAPDVADVHDAEALDELQMRLERSSAHRLASHFALLHPYGHDAYRQERTSRGIER